MATKINSWSPDTCDCKLHYTWDDSVPQDQIVTTFLAVEDVCEDHVSLVSNNTLLSSDSVGKNGLNIIKKALDENEVNNKASVKEQRERKRFKVRGIFLDNNAGQPTALEKRKEEEEDRIIEEGLRKHRKAVEERYEIIFSRPFALSNNIYDIVKQENKLKNDTFKLLLRDENTPSFMIGNNTTLNPDVEFRFFWAGKAPNRKLNIEFVDTRTGIPVIIPKGEYQKTLDKQLGKNKVAVL